jgi:molybdopterin molybdotransferase
VSGPGGLISVEEALSRLLTGVEPLGTQTLPLAKANGRVLARDLSAHRDQPPFPASAMDGYAVRAEDIADPPAVLKVVGEAPAGHAFGGRVGPGEAVRIFTGAPVPEGANTILIQENASREGERVTALEPVQPGRFIRAAGLDFAKGEVLLSRGRRLGYRDLALAAAMNHGSVSVHRKPKVAVLATGDELVAPGGTPAADQIIASNDTGLAAFIEECGGEAVCLGIARDTHEALAEKIDTARAQGADILVTLGGASVGDHDLVQDALGNAGMDLAFWRIAMRPGKPLMAGTIGDMRVLGLPGNPVSSLVCALLFLKPLILAMSGHPHPMRQRRDMLPLAGPVPANDRREDYLRASLVPGADGIERVQPFERQDSSMLATFARADALIVRPPHAEALEPGAPVPVLRLNRD